MRRQHIEGDALRVIQSKTGEALPIPMHPELIAGIERHPLGHRTLEQAAVYPRDAAQARLAEQAMRRRAMAEKRTAGVKRFDNPA